MKPIIVILTVALGLNAQLRAQVDPYDSGGPLMPEQAAYNIRFYDLQLQVNPADSTIAGTLLARAEIVSPTEWFVLDIDPVLAVDTIYLVDAGGRKKAAAYERRGGKIWIAFPVTRQPGEFAAAEIHYGGRPRIAPRPPWDGGFTWARTASGQPWIATSCQDNGADVWWPNKDHVSDKPDSMALHITVPEPLVVASNGVLRRVDAYRNGMRTYYWAITNPISNYNVALNIAPYKVITARMKSVAGSTFPVFFWVLPESYRKGQKLFPEILEHLRFFEKLIGPYPFRAEKYGVAETPHLGMEHQTIIAYGAKFRNAAMTGGRDWGFDALHHHELSHEWWGNLITNFDWRDMWIHEGIGTYMQALYLEEKQGIETYHAYMQSIKHRMRNRMPVAPRISHSARQIGGDVYFKGAWMLHSLRYLIGKKTLVKILRKMAYPDESHRSATDGSQCRFVTTRDFVNLSEEVSGRELRWFFEIYLRRAKLPVLHVRHEGDALDLRWEVPDDLPFPMPVEVEVKGKRRQVKFVRNHARLQTKAAYRLDPEDWILKKVADESTGGSPR